ncbi:hypothetical protein PF001_g14922 [Phytophthora fragariae]|uniref:Uncharacterized protein n=1 Tax=Phytophthora fragariae TaxID=53985 RepID=A0A6A3EK57_9STRA|nr:hypothetical protein PF009_g16136 [Phytophthora fragariae]KAE9300486.1 hypothetical protein PF001_g14922 [Phytophthora fragariae]
MAKPKKTTAAGFKQRALKGRASGCAAAISRFQAAQDIARVSSEGLGRDNKMADNRDATPSQAGGDAAMAGGSDAAPSKAGNAADTPPRTAADRAAHARAAKTEKQAHRKEVHELREQQAAHARAFKKAKLGKPTQPKDSDKKLVKDAAFKDFSADSEKQLTHHFYDMHELVTQCSALPSALLPTAAATDVFTPLNQDEFATLEDIFSLKERRKFVQRTAQVLFVVEFVILVEYTEVIVPFIFCMYTTSMHYLPNREHYAQIRALDSEGLSSMLSSVAVFGFVEFLSLLILGFVVQRTIGFSILHMLSFVLVATRPVKLVLVDLFHDNEFAGAQRCRLWLVVQLAQKQPCP